MQAMLPLSCSLCSSSLSRSPIKEGANCFCCPGCHAVFNILFSQNQLAGFQTHPIFLQALKTGLISNPELLQAIAEKNKSISERPSERLTLEIKEMWCPSCAEIISLLLLQERGIKKTIVDYSTDLAVIDYCPTLISKDRILTLINSFGYKAEYLENREGKAISFSLTFRFLVAAFFSLNIMMFSYPLYATYFDFEDQGMGSLFAWISFFASLPVLFYSGLPILKRFYLSLKVGILGMETLVVMGVFSAFSLSLVELWQGGTRVYFDSMTVIITFMLLGKMVESKAKFSAKDALLTLTKALPRKGRKRDETGKEAFVPLKSFQKGDLLIVCTGEKIVLDGEVSEGSGSCDESLLTGEAIPIFKEKGTLVLGGTILQSGWLAIKVTRTEEESALQRIIQMVEKDIGQKTYYVRAVDQIIQWFVPSVLAIAFAAGVGTWLLGIQEGHLSIFETAILRAAAVLLISCPCAIGIAAPLAEAHLINGLAKMGAIVRNRGSLRYLGRESALAFDKTGTVTEGRFEILEGLLELDKNWHPFLKGLVSYSTHPVATGIHRALKSVSFTFEQVEEYSGFGIKGVAQGKVFLVGSEVFLKKQGVKVPENNYLKTHLLPVTKVYFAGDGLCLTTFKLGDKIREETPKVLRSISPSKSLLISGDTLEPVKAVAEACGFDLFYPSCTPSMKRDLIEELKKEGHIVAMIGDGINDAPSLTASHVGISVVSATDISIQVSDLLLTTDRLSVLPKIRALAQKGRKIIYQNLFWAFFYNVLGIPLAIFGFLSPLYAAFAMIASSLIVLFNAHRLSNPVKDNLP